MTKDAAESHDFSPYSQLVASLLPRAAGLSIFQPDGALRWTSDEMVLPELPLLVSESCGRAALCDEAGERVTLTSSEPVYLFWLRRPDGRPAAILAVRWRSSENDPRAFSYVHAMLRPVVECLKRELLLHARLAATVAAMPAVAPDDGDLRLLLATPEANPTGNGDITQLISRVNQHMQCELAALLMPERNMVVVTRAAGRNVDTSILIRAHRHLLALAQQRKEALLLNEPDSVPGLDLPMRALVSPARNTAGGSSAVLILFRGRESAAFQRRDGLLADLFVRRVAAVIEARYDALTGLFARQAFEPRVTAQLAQRRDVPWSFLYLDADRLHAINDLHGMEVGDRLLMKLGELVRSRLPPGALSARMGGDRFAILLPANDTDALAFAEGLRAAVEALSSEELGARDEVVHSTLSIGVAMVDAEGQEPVSALAAAEAACLQAKSRGRNRVERFAPVAAEEAAAESTAPTEEGAQAVRDMLASGHLSLYAQLIAPLPGNTRPTPHFELLLRVREAPGEALSSPGRFLTAAARHGVMQEVDRWVVRETLALLGPRAPLIAGGAVVFTLNLSAQSLGDLQFGIDLLAQIKESGVDPRALCVEFSEAGAIAHVAAASSLLNELRLRGCHVALDDFGTSAASLADLRALPLTMVKIDGVFVRDLVKDARAEKLVKGMAQLARAAGLATVAECVETDETRARLATLGVDFGQGYAIAAPVPLADAIRELPTWASTVRKRQGSDVELGAKDDTVSTALQEELQRELEAAGIDPVLEELDPEATDEIPPDMMAVPWYKALRAAE